MVAFVVRRSRNVYQAEAAKGCDRLFWIAEDWLRMALSVKVAHCPMICHLMIDSQIRRRAARFPE
jgi:hypothetical protein